LVPVTSGDKQHFWIITAVYQEYFRESMAHLFVELDAAVIKLLVKSALAGSYSILLER